MDPASFRGPGTGNQAVFHRAPLVKAKSIGFNSGPFRSRIMPPLGIHVKPHMPLHIFVFVFVFVKPQLKVTKYLILLAVNTSYLKKKQLLFPNCSLFLTAPPRLWYACFLKRHTNYSHRNETHRKTSAHDTTSQLQCPNPSCDSSCESLTIRFPFP